MGEYKITRLHRGNYKTTEWSGGTTTELSIAPEGAVYADRDFEWRLSSATVEVEESNFTPLPDYNRIIMTLKGGIRLSHNGGEWLTLPEFTTHSFDGGDETVSVGKVIDFNLMLRKGVCGGAVIPYALKDGEEVRTDRDLQAEAPNYSTVMFYCYEGTALVVLVDGKETLIGRGETLKLTGDLKNIPLSCRASFDTRVIAAAVRRL